MFRSSCLSLLFTFGFVQFDVPPGPAASVQFLQTDGEEILLEVLFLGNYDYAEERIHQLSYQVKAFVGF